MLDLARSTGKKMLGRSPAAYRIGQAIFNKVKSVADRSVFLKRYPKASYIDLSRDKLAELAVQGYSSQYGQDWYLWNKVFHGKKFGTFIDIGGNDPIKLSNSYFFELQGWQGFAFDPLERAAKAWAKDRSATFHHAAISDKKEVRDFVEINTHEGWEHALSGFAGFVRDEDKDRYGYKQYQVTAAPLDHFLPADIDIDIIMIDVEGAENVVLDGIDLSCLRPAYVMIENVSQAGGGEEIRRKMAASGYIIVSRIGGADDLFART